MVFRGERRVWFACWPCIFVNHNGFNILLYEFAKLLSGVWALYAWLDRRLPTQRPWQHTLELNIEQNLLIYVVPQTREQFGLSSKLWKGVADVPEIA